MLFHCQLHIHLLVVAHEMNLLIVLLKNGHGRYNELVGKRDQFNGQDLFEKLKLDPSMNMRHTIVFFKNVFFKKLRV